MQKQSDAVAPAIFVGHGNPMNAIEPSEWSTSWRALGATLRHPKAICVISAHWLTHGTFVHVGAKPRTIHDFGGFPEELFRVAYNAPGAPEVARGVVGLLKDFNATPDTSWGLDHGAWSVLVHLFPHADIPVFQVSLDVGKSTLEHAHIAKALGALRDQNVLVLGSGNIVHNLSDMSFETGAVPLPYATRFDERVATLIAERNFELLFDHTAVSTDSPMAVPTPDHYWPLAYILALARPRDQITFPTAGIAHGSISMRAVMVG